MSRRSSVVACSVCCFLVFVFGVSSPATAEPPISPELAALKAQIRNVGAQLEELRKEQDAQTAKFKKARESRYYCVSGKNFLVGAVGESFSRAVLSRAEEFRKQIAMKWLGRELPEGKGFAIIHVRISDEKDEGLTLLSGPGRRFTGKNRIWLTTSKQRALGSTLAHEITHLVFDTRFKDGMPAWAHEGIASLRDDAGRFAERQKILRGFASRNKWPSLERLLNLRGIRPTDSDAYAAATSLVQFLLEKGDRKALISFVEDAIQDGWTASLKRHYKLQSIQALQDAWQLWVKQHLGNTTI